MIINNKILKKSLLAGENSDEFSSSEWQSNFCRLKSKLFLLGLVRLFSHIEIFPRKSCLFWTKKTRRARNGTKNKTQKIYTLWRMKDGKAKHFLDSTNFRLLTTFSATFLPPAHIIQIRAMKMEEALEKYFYDGTIFLLKKTQRNPTRWIQLSPYLSLLLFFLFIRFSFISKPILTVMQPQLLHFSPRFYQNEIN